MAWKSREDKMPPPSFFSMMVAYLQRAYPGAQISREHPEEQPHPAEQPHSAGRRRRGRPRSADTQRKPTSAPGSSVESQSAALFSAMQGLLPNMAAQLVDAMAKEGGGK